MPAEQASESLGLNLSLQRPAPSDLRQIPATRDKDGRIIYPEVDADGDHLHFEMVPMSGESLLWLTLRRGDHARSCERCTPKDRRPHRSSR